jgi:hypothetical protein
MKRKLPAHIVLPDGRWRFVKKGSIKPKKSVVKVARYRRARRAYSAYRSFRGRRGGKLGGMKSLIAPLLGGAGDAFLAGRIPVNGVGATVAGFALGDHTTRQIGLYQIGYSGAQMFLGGGGGGVSGGGLL